MAEVPFKTYLKDLFEVVLTGETIIRQILISPTNTIQRENVLVPFTSIYDEVQSVQKRNQQEHVNIDIILETYYETDESNSSESLLVQGDLIEATLHRSIWSSLNTGTLNKKVQNANRKPFVIQQVGDTEAILIMTYNMDYLQPMGNEFITI